MLGAEISDFVRLIYQMAKIYISSTYSDLKEYREGVYHALRKLGHDAIAMEDYTATDQRRLISVWLM